MIALKACAMFVALNVTSCLAVLLLNLPIPIWLVGVVNGGLLAIYVARLKGESLPWD